MLVALAFLGQVTPKPINQDRQLEIIEFIVISKKNLLTIKLSN